jgi:hypothetical protein
MGSAGGVLLAGIASFIPAIFSLLLSFLPDGTGILK